MSSEKLIIPRKCSGCKKVLEVSDIDVKARCQNYLQTNDGRAWHAECLVCSCCKCPLYDDGKSVLSSKCYNKCGRLYCQKDYVRFSPVPCEFKLPPTCMSCQLQILPGEEVIHSPLNTFHAHCFSCDICGKTLLPGQPYFLIDGYPVCLDDTIRVRQAEMSGNCLQLSFSTSNHRYARRKRIRTSFNEQQQLSMQAFFAQNQNPNANELMGLSEETGLAKRVLQVWFQNARAKLRRTNGGSERNIMNSSMDDRD